MDRRQRLEQFEQEQSIAFGGGAIGAWPRHKGEKLRPHKGGGGGDGGARQMEEERQARINAAVSQINNIFNNKVPEQRTRYKGPSSTISEDEYKAMVEHEQKMLQQFTSQRNKTGLPINNALQAQNQMLPQFTSQLNKTGMPINKALQEQNQMLQQFNMLQRLTSQMYRPETYTEFVDGDPANSREQMYTNQRQAVYDLNTRDVNRQAADAERLNRFALARNGLLGGSADVDSGFEINRMTNEGLMKAGGIADQAAADLRMSDERTRGNLISMAQSGIDTGTAQQMALSGLAANAEAAKSSAAAATVGDLFSGLSGAYMANMYNKAYNSGLNKSRMQQFTPGLGGVQSSYGGNVAK